ncbi:MAG TPA: hypothetical protein VLC98_01795 [Phnomibacter sp.]|nr:hypothetical protein [Phnomibacter sp.]
MGKWLLIASILFCSCVRHQIAGRFPNNTADETYTGTRFFELAKSVSWKQRDSLALDWFSRGAIPGFWKQFSSVTISRKDSLGKKQRLQYWVSPDYFAVGTNNDWVRVPITPMAAQQMMDDVQCVFPTRKMVDQVYDAATVKLAPVPMYAFRDSGITMYQHHLMIEGQRKGKKGLIAGIKKDVAITYKVPYGAKTDRVAIYGWHQLNGKAIQPLHLGHVNWYVDYSHGIRFVSTTAKMNGKTITIDKVLSDPSLQSLLCNEDTCGNYRYPQ